METQTKMRKMKTDNEYERNSEKVFIEKDRESWEDILDQQNRSEYTWDIRIRVTEEY